MRQPQRLGNAAFGAMQLDVDGCLKRDHVTDAHVNGLCTLPSHDHRAPITSPLSTSKVCPNLSTGVPIKRLFAVPTVCLPKTSRGDWQTTPIQVSKSLSIN